MRKTPIKGEPSFSNLNDERVKGYRAMITDLIGAYSELPEEQAVLKKIWKDLSNECADRIKDTPDEVKPVLRQKTRFLRSINRK